MPTVVFALIAALSAGTALALPDDFEAEHTTPATVHFPGETRARTGRLVVAVPREGRWWVSLTRRAFFEEAVDDGWVDHTIPWACQLKVRELLTAYTVVRVSSPDGEDFGVLEHLSFTIGPAEAVDGPAYAEVQDLHDTFGRFTLTSHPDGKTVERPLREVRPYRVQGRSCGSMLRFWNWFR